MRHPACNPFKHSPSWTEPRGISLLPAPPEGGRGWGRGRRCQPFTKEGILFQTPDISLRRLKFNSFWLNRLFNPNEYNCKVSIIFPFGVHHCKYYVLYFFAFWKCVGEVEVVWIGKFLSDRWFFHTVFFVPFFWEGEHHFAWAFIMFDNAFIIRCTWFGFESG